MLSITGLKTNDGYVVNNTGTYYIWFKDINNKKIVDYSNQEIKIYTTAENIAKLKANYGKILEDERNLYYENLLSDYKLTIKEKDERIAELEEALDSCNLEE